MTYAIIPVAEINDGTRAHLTLTEAAERLGVAPGTIRRNARRLGVRRIHGRTVAAGLLISDISGPDIVIAIALA